MSSAEVMAPVRARPVVPSAMVTRAPLEPAATHGEGRVVARAWAAAAEAEAEAAAADALEAEAEALTAEAEALMLAARLVAE
jgi:hypothetical protein